MIVIKYVAIVNVSVLGRLLLFELEQSLFVTQLFLFALKSNHMYVCLAARPGQARQTMIYDRTAPIVQLHTIEYQRY
jgi:hypothetical protein